MNSAQVLGYPLLLIAALEVLLGRLLLTQHPRNSAVNRATAACVFAAALWSLSSSLMYIRLSLGLDYILFARTSWIGWFTVPAAIQSVLYLGDRQSRKARVAGLVLYPLWTAVLALCIFTDLVVTDGYVPLPYRNSPGPIEMPLRLLGSLQVVWLIIEILRLRRQVTGLRRSQLSYYLYGTIFFGTGGAVVGGLLQLFTGTGLEPSLSAYFGFPWALMIFYAITRYRLFDIRIVLSRALGILALSLITAGFQFLMFTALEPMLGSMATIFLSMPLIGIVFFGTPASRTVLRWINELVLGERLAAQNLLKETANASISILYLDELLHFIIDRVREGLKIERACLFLREQDGRYVTRECFLSLQRPTEPLALPQPVADRLAADPRMLIRDELESSRDPRDAELANDLGVIGAELVLPLVSKRQLLGVLALGERASGDPYLHSDIDLLETLAGHAATAIENARLFEEAGLMRATIQEQEGIFRTLANTLPATIFIHRGGRFLYFNATGTRMTGYTSDEILNMDFWDVVHPDYRELIMARGRSRLAGSEPPPQYEFKIVRKDGKERWVLMSAGTIVYEGKTAVIGTIFDITDRKEAEEDRERHYRERLAEQERFSAVLSTTNEGFWIVNEHDRIVFVNDAYCRISGYRREELLTMSIADVEAEESQATVREHTERIRRAGYDRFETRHRRKDGTLVDLEVSVNRYRDGTTVFAFLRDITERIRAEQERSRLYEESVTHYQALLDEQHRHQEEKERILKDLHDGIGGLTTNINLLAELARKDDDPGSIKRSLATIAELSRESLAEIRGFIQSLDARELSWQAVAAEFRHLGTTIVASHGIRFSISADVPDSGTVPSSTMAMNLFRIYKEALANVVKHAKATEVNVAFAVGAGGVTLDVHDNGVGVQGTRSGGRGLLNMRSRTQELGGTLTMTGGPGTHIVAVIPIP